MQNARSLQRDDSRIIIHFDYDCFYASVVENENPALKSVPLAIQQKQIVVTCNYEARRRGLRKLQLITEAKRVCPDAVIVLGEDLTRFRDASKELYGFLQRSVWSGRAERLGFDEVWLDCTDMVDYNVGLLNQNDLTHSFFCLARDDPTVGFDYDASTVFGPTFPAHAFQRASCTEEEAQLRQRLVVGSHLARHLRHELESQKGYTSTVGIATNKLLAKLVGNVNKPKSQTTILPPYRPVGHVDATVTQFLDKHDIGKIPGIGFKLAQKIRTCVLGRQLGLPQPYTCGDAKYSVTVQDVRSHSGMGPEMLEEILGGAGSPRGIGGKVWELIHGIDDSEVGKVKRVPSQISQEDSYPRYLVTFAEVKKQLHTLSERLIRRMRMDLLEDEEGEGEEEFRPREAGPRRRWMAHPRTIRLSTRARPATAPDGARQRMSNRISRSAPMPNLVFSLVEEPSILADRLVEETLVPMFRKLHHEKAGWNLNLINVAVTNMAETAAESKDSQGRDIGRMFRRQDEVLKDFRVTVDSEGDDGTGSLSPRGEHLDPEIPDSIRNAPKADCLATDDWDFEGDDGQQADRCEYCHYEVPSFALAAHRRYHELGT
ncbi:DNA polymerase iota subunit [Capronia coronata CBS 617.96]|uniref:DNA polymerase iota subunit n=1 Tax=Capronia coronata CBS 617.96 TaxID=1182541 RepID=W9Z1H1_9EURO|nr:DNA polymerase iota subunit [Capronia coronata CBS 617.96]EXJ95406.1 DNA polymerase iota subunit [Capronia coronata CBS 617.96]